MALAYRHWSRQEYDRLIELGVVRPDERIELVGGQLIVAEPKNSPHSTAVGLTAEALRTAFGPGWVVRIQDAIALDDESEPEPDVAVVRGEWRDFRCAHPSRPALVVEVAESSLAFDRRYKGSLYARAALPEYWIVNLRRRVLEVHREPAPKASARFGWSYASVRTLGDARAIAPLAAPSATIAVAHLLP